jgi:ABC-type glycerol-3-phosphate transport system permease component
MTRGFAPARDIAGKAVHAAVLVFFVTFLAFPFYWMLITAFKANQDLYNTQTILTCSTALRRCGIFPCCLRTLNTCNGC